MCSQATSTVIGWELGPHYLYLDLWSQLAKYKKNTDEHTRTERLYHTSHRLPVLITTIEPSAWSEMTLIIRLSCLPITEHLAEIQKNMRISWKTLQHCLYSKLAGQSEKTSKEWTWHWTSSDPKVATAQDIARTTRDGSSQALWQKQINIVCLVGF